MNDTTTGPWWLSHPDVCGGSLGPLLDRAGVRLADVTGLAAQTAIKKFTYHSDPVQRRLFTWIASAIKIDGELARHFGERGDTHTRVSRAMGRNRDFSARWVKASERSWIKAHELVSLMGGDSFSPPVRRWLVEQLGLELGFIVTVDEVDDTAPDGGSVEGHVVDVAAAFGRLSAAVAEAREGGVSPDEARSCKVRLHELMSEATEMLATLDELEAKR